MKVGCQLHAHGRFTPGENPNYLLHRGLDVSKSRSGCFEDRNLLPLPEIELRFVGTSLLSIMSHLF